SITPSSPAPSAIRWTLGFRPERTEQPVPCLGPLPAALDQRRPVLHVPYRIRTGGERSGQDRRAFPRHPLLLHGRSPRDQDQAALSSGDVPPLPRRHDEVSEDRPARGRGDETQDPQRRTVMLRVPRGASSPEEAVSAERPPGFLPHHGPGPRRS